MSIITKRGGETAVITKRSMSDKAAALVKAICLVTTYPLDTVGIMLSPDDLRAMYEAIVQYHKENQLRELTVEVDTVMGSPSDDIPVIPASGLSGSCFVVGKVDWEAGEL